MKLNRRLLLCLLIFNALLLLYSNSLAQNHVPNPGFESYSNCPAGLSQFNQVNDWFNPSLQPQFSTPDYFNVCNTTSCSAGVPDNRFGNGINAYSGQAYAGILTYYLLAPDAREYISIRLTQPLLTGYRYHVSAQVRRSPASYFATQFGIHLDTARFLQTNATPFNRTPNVLETFPVSDTNWTLLSTVYTSFGGEQYLLIGNMRNDSLTISQPLGSSSNPCSTLFADNAAYYFIDEVSITRLTTSSSELMNENSGKINLYPNPFENVLKAEIPPDWFLEKIYLEIYSPNGLLLQREGPFSNADVEINLNHSLPDGLYFIKLFTESRSHFATQRMLRMSGK